MPKIFISYRRQDSPYETVSISNRLASRFGRANVFLDIAAIPLGEKFREKIAQQVASCDYLIAVVGKSWLTINDQEGRRRLDNPDDFVRLEIKAALERNIPVIAVLLHNFPMPLKELLPPDLADLTERQAISVRPLADFDSDLDELVDRIDKEDKDRSKQQRAGFHRARRAGAPVLASALVITLGAYLLGHRSVRPDPGPNHANVSDVPQNLFSIPESFPDVKTSGLPPLTDRDRSKSAYKSSSLQIVNKTGTTIQLDLAYEPHDPENDRSRVSKYYHRLEGPIDKDGTWESTETDFGGPLHLSVYSYADQQWHPTNKWYDLQVVPSRTVVVHQTQIGFLCEVKIP